MEINAENGGTLWYDAIQKEMQNVAIAFKLLDAGEPLPLTYKRY